MPNLLSEITKFEDSEFEPTNQTRYFVRGIEETAVGACCEDDGEGGVICEDLSEDDCNSVGGTFVPDVTCADDPCLTGACCTGDLVFPCEEVSEVDCSGTFKGVGTHCDDDPNPCPPTGSCCYNQFETCSDNMTESDCSDSEGVYQGDGTNCTDDPCCFCPGINLECDSISANGNKCGIFNPDDGKYYFNKDTETFIYILNHGSSGCQDPFQPPPATITCFIDSERYFHKITHESKTLNEDGSCSTTTTTCEDVPGDGHAAIGYWYGGDCSLCLDPDNCQGTSISYNSCTQPRDVDTTSNCHISGPGTSSSTTDIVAYDNEYTTAMLISQVEGQLPSYFGHMGCDEDETIGFRTSGQNCVCFASRDLSSDENGYSITRFKYRFTFEARDCDFTISWNVRTDYEGGGGFDTPMSEDITAGATISSIYIENEPSVDGTVHITDIVCTPAIP